MIIMITMTSNLKLKREPVCHTLAVAQTFRKRSRLIEGEWILIATNDDLNIKDTEYKTMVMAHYSFYEDFLSSRFS